MEQAGVPSVQEGIPAALALYRERLLALLKPEDVRLKPGVRTLLGVLACEPGLTLGLLTGNLEECARTKLAPFGLNPFFSFGAFGSDHEDRERLPGLAVERAERLTGLHFEGKNIVVVGDSVHDVRCGRRLGVRSVAVATGPTTPERLAQESPDVLLEDLSDIQASIAAITGVS